MGFGFNEEGLFDPQIVSDQKPEVITLGPVTKEQLDAVRCGAYAKPFCRPAIDHPKPVNEIEWTPAKVESMLIEAGMLPDPTQPPKPEDHKVSLVEVRGTTQITTILTAYIDVGTMQSSKAEAHVEKMKDHWQPAFSRLPDHVAVVYVPVRGRPTSFETIVLSGR